MYPIEEGDEDINRERKPSRPYRLHLLTGLVLTWGQQVTEVLQLELSKISHTGQTCWKTCLHMIILCRPI